MANDSKRLALPAPEGSTLPATIERIAFYQAPAPEPESQASTIPIAHYLWMINRHKWRLGIFVAIAVAATVVVSSRMTKIYEATATIDVDRSVASGVVGQESVAGRVASLNDSEMFLTTQVSLIKSDAVLRPVVEKLRINTSD